MTRRSFVLPNLLPDDLWTKIEALFQEASELPAADREAFVREKCGGDIGIRDEVLALLVFCDDEKPELLDALGADAASVVGDGPVSGARSRRNANFSFKIRRSE